MEKIEALKRVAENAGCLVLKDEPMSRHTTFQIGGPADLYIAVKDIIALKDIVRTASSLNIPLLPLGNGSNVLVSDEGIRGAVLSLTGDFRRITLADPTTISCGSGATLASLCKFAQRNGLTGLEFAWGIPGSVGGAVFMNAGAYEGQFSDVLISATHVTTTGKTDSLLGPEMEMDYRKSAYQKNDCIITSVVARLEQGSPEQISLQMDDYFRRRKEKQPLEMPSAGSIFKRPDGAYAGALIEQCGLKGEKIGGAMVSEKHAGFIVNTGDATCSDVMALIEKIQKTVQKQTGVSLECEVRPIS